MNHVCDNIIMPHIGFGNRLELQNTKLYVTDGLQNLSEDWMIILNLIIKYGRARANSSG